MANTDQIALVTGGNRGIGLEICRQLADKGMHVILTSRSEEKGMKAVKSLQKKDYRISYYHLDVTDEEDILKLKIHLEKEFGKLDILVNNAGILIDKGSLTGTSTSVIRETMETNFFGPLNLIKAMATLLKKSTDARIINMSSGMASLNTMGSGSPAYRISKVALNALTIILANELGSSVKVYTMSPGWVRTEMGGSGAPRSVEEGADTALWLATAENIPDGKFYQNRKVIEW